MKKAISAATFLLLSAAFAAPAIAKTSITKSHAVCEAAAKAQDPAPKSVRADKDQTRVSNDTVTVTLRVKNADDTSAKLLCTVDRENSAPILKLAS
jgi:hypothetical protein